MTNKEKYKQAFSKVHISENFSLEARDMKRTSGKMKLNRMVASIAACALVAGSAVAYAEDIGGIQRNIQLWIHGEQTNVTIDFDGEGNYEMNYTDADGSIKNRGGGGVAYGLFGKERPLTEEELMEEMSAPEVEYKEDGSVWVYWFEQKVDITDKFEDDICYVELQNQGEVLYMTVKYRDGHATSGHKYVDASEFN